MKYTIKQDKKITNTITVCAVPITAVTETEKYAVCLVKGKAKNRSQALKQVFDWDEHPPYSKGTGYFASQTLLAELTLQTPRVYVVHVTGKQLLKTTPQVSDDQYVIFPYSAYSQYEDWMYGCEGVQHANIAHHQRWDFECVKFNWESQFDRKNKRLPRDVANSLIAQHHREVNTSCLDWFSTCVSQQEITEAVA